MATKIATAGSLVAKIPGTMLTRTSGKKSLREVTPLFSFTREQARRRVLTLYRAWYREIPYLLMDYDVPVDISKCRKRLKEIFLANKNVSDVRAIDILLAKGQMELRETIEVWKQKTHFMAYFRDTHPHKSSSFLSKFLHGKE